MAMSTNAGLLVLAIIVVASLVAAALIGGVFLAVNSGGSLYVVNRFTGAVRECTIGECRAVTEVNDPPNHARNREPARDSHAPVARLRDRRDCLRV